MRDDLRLLPAEARIAEDGAQDGERGIGGWLGDGSERASAAAEECAGTMREGLA